MGRVTDRVVLLLVDLAAVPVPALLVGSVVLLVASAMVPVAAIRVALVVVLAAHPQVHLVAAPAPTLAVLVDLPAVPMVLLLAEIAGVRRRVAQAGDREEDQSDFLAVGWRGTHCKTATSATI